MVNSMETEKMARILMNMALDMDYMDSADVIQEEMEMIISEINTLDKHSSLYQMLYSIAYANEYVLDLVGRMKGDE